MCGANLAGGITRMGAKPDMEVALKSLPAKRGSKYYIYSFSMIAGALLVVSALVFLSYMILRGSEAEKEEERYDRLIQAEVPGTKAYENDELFFSFNYADLWQLTERQPLPGDLLDLSVSFTSRIGADIKVSQVPPEIVIGGITEVYYYVNELLLREEPINTMLPVIDFQDEAAEGGLLEEGPVELRKVVLNGIDGFRAEFDTDGPDGLTRHIRYYLLSGDILYSIDLHAPLDSWDDTLSKGTIIFASFKVDRDE